LAIVVGALILSIILSLIFPAKENAAAEADDAE
jgi:hypothetical protein